MRLILFQCVITNKNCTKSYKIKHIFNNIWLNEDLNRPCESLHQTSLNASVWQADASHHKIIRRKNSNSTLTKIQRVFWESKDREEKGRSCYITHSQSIHLKTRTSGYSQSSSRLFRNSLRVSEWEHLDDADCIC